MIISSYHSINSDNTTAIAAIHTLESLNKRQGLPYVFTQLVKCAFSRHYDFLFNDPTQASSSESIVNYLHHTANMPPKKKAKKSPKEPEDPLEYINYVREKAEKSFAAKGRKSNTNYDIEQNVREIRALLNINKEIFDRCKSSGGIIKKQSTFTRYGYEVVKVRQSSPDKVQFITEPEKTQKTFDMTPLTVLPKGLDDVFVAKYQNEYPSFIDFDKFFQTVIMLQDDILEQCLAKLKQHIESIHVCLGEIETWLLEPKSSIDYINGTFKKKLKSLTDDDVGNMTSPSGSDICMNCSSPFSSHHQNAYYPSSPRSCPQYVGTSFACKKYTVLKTCNESGKFEKTFTIAKESDQTKLKKFLDFVSS